VSADGVPEHVARFEGDRWIAGFGHDLFFRGGDALYRVRAGIAAGAPTLVADLATHGVGSPIGLTVVGNRLYFIATQSGAGGERLAYIDVEPSTQGDRVTVMDFDDWPNGAAPFVSSHIVSIHPSGSGGLIGFEQVDDGQSGTLNQVFRVDPSGGIVNRVPVPNNGPLGGGLINCATTLNGMVVFEGPFQSMRQWLATDGHDIYGLGQETLSCSEGGLVTSDGQLLARAEEPGTGHHAFSVRGYGYTPSNLGFDALGWAELDGSLFFLGADGLSLYDYALNETPEVIHMNPELMGTPVAITGTPWLALSAQGSSDQLVCIDPTTPTVRPITVRSGAAANVRQVTVLR
jgi:hypothetical protein